MKYNFITSLFIICFCCLVSCVTNESTETGSNGNKIDTELTNNQLSNQKQQLQECNDVLEFSQTPVEKGYLYFSYINPFYLEAKEENYLFNVITELIHFIDLKLGYGSYDQTYGSFILSDQKIQIFSDANLADQLIEIVELHGKIKETSQGDIITIKVAKDKILPIWQQFHDIPLPNYSFTIDQKINHRNIPLWVLSPPKKEGYIFGVGVYSDISETSKLIQYADISARKEILKSIYTNTKGELTDYFEDNFELLSFFNQQSSVARLPGIYIINRYYDATSKRAYSLAVLQYKK
ncbi:MAG: LPP20 family lipoprotein [Spirochaetes bacterium]|nr:LPP20 family lipoprotein [Spirochaetota bacterium]